MNPASKRYRVMSALPIFPGGCPPSIFGTFELNYRVRHGYGCILTAIATESESLFSQNYTEEVPKALSSRSCFCEIKKTSTY